MKNFFLAFGVFLLWSIFGLWVYSWLQPQKKSAKLEPVTIENISLDNSKLNDNSILEPTSRNSANNTKQADNITEKSIKKEDKELVNGLKAISQDGMPIFIFPEGISFKKNSPELIIAQSLTDYKLKIKEYIIEHPEQELHIGSIYSPMEHVLSPNLGIQRADKISDQLIKAGVSKEKIVLKSIIKDISFDEEGIFNNSISFSFKPLDELRIASLKKEIPKTKIVYPRYSGTGIVVNKNLRLLLSELISYYNDNPNKKIDIVGHTDNIGNSKDNYTIGLKYSKQVRQYLISKGKLDGSLIRATSKGESEPIDDNHTKRGRIANKRIEVIFY